MLSQCYRTWTTNLSSELTYSFFCLSRMMNLIKNTTIMSTNQLKKALLKQFQIDESLLDTILDTYTSDKKKKDK